MKKTEENNIIFTSFSLNLYDRCCLFNSWLVVVSLHEITMWLRQKDHCYISQVASIEATINNTKF